MMLENFRHAPPACPLHWTWPADSVITEHYRRHRHQEFLRFFTTIDEAAPVEFDLHLDPALDKAAALLHG